MMKRSLDGIDLTKKVKKVRGLGVPGHSSDLPVTHEIIVNWQPIWISMPERMLRKLSPPQALIF